MSPNCHGLAACISLTSPKCQKCASAHSCASLALLDLEVAGEALVLGAERQRLMLFMQRAADMPPQRAEGAVEPSIAALLPHLAPRVASQVRNLHQKGWFTFAREELQRGRNPASKGWRRIFCQLLLERRCGRHTLQHALMSELAMSEGSARATASIAISIMAAGGLAVEVQGSVRFTPNRTPQN